MRVFCQRNLVLKMNKKCKNVIKRDLVKRYIVCLFNKFVCYFLEQVRSHQENLTWQEIWRTFICLFKVPWNDHLVNYFPLMYRYGINTNILHLTFFSCATVIISYKMLIITGIWIEKTNELTIYGILCRKVNILPTRTSFFFSSARKIESVQKFRTKLLE